jgi:DNA invertase Pin-like site-specific DNA recombinase
VFSEKVSGAVTDRAALAKAIAALGSGDTLVVCKLDRLARSTRDLLNTLAAIAEAGAAFKSLGDPWCDTTTPQGRLILTVLGGLAEFERFSSPGPQVTRRAALQLNALSHARYPRLRKRRSERLPGPSPNPRQLRKPLRLSKPSPLRLLLLASLGFALDLGIAGMIILPS